MATLPAAALVGCATSKSAATPVAKPQSKPEPWIGNASGIDDVTSRQQRWPVKSLTSYTVKDANDLKAMPAQPTLIDFLRNRFLLAQHLLYACQWAVKQGLPEPIALACLLHDCGQNIARPEHGYWAAMLVRPYVTEETAWAIEAHQALRWYADEKFGYKGPPEFYKTYFGQDANPPGLIPQQYADARKHKWYGNARLVTMSDQETPEPKDLYISKEKHEVLDPQIFEDLIGRNFKQPKEGLGYDGSPVAHMWRTIIDPSRLL
jgi:hypothetical protein